MQVYVFISHNCKSFSGCVIILLKERMKRPVVKKAKAENFSDIYSLLLKFDSPNILEDDWRNLFIRRWDNKEDYFGYMLVDNDKVVGFFGLIFCERYINNNKSKFCNLTSWIVEPEYRAHSLSLLKPVLRLEGYTLTNFTAVEQVYKIFKRFGFKELGAKVNIILPLPLSNSFFKKCDVLFDRDEIALHLSPGDLKIYNDHFHFKSRYILLISGRGSCFIVVTRVYRKKIPFAYVHYIGNLDLFVGHINKAKFSIIRKLKVAALLVDERLLRKKKLPFAVNYNMPLPKLYRSETLSRYDIDSLYSECILMNS